MLKRTAIRSGQSIVEYVILLALITILIVTVVAGLGRRSQSRVAQANEALDEAAVASGTSSGGGKMPVGGVAGGRPGPSPKGK
jgi:Flp pilus assembly pilin Flp